MQTNSAISWKSALTNTSQYFWKSFSEYFFHHLAESDNMIQSSCKMSSMIFQTTCFSVVKNWCDSTWYIFVTNNHQDIFVNSFCFFSRWWRILNKYIQMYLYLIDISLIENFFIICSCLTEIFCVSASVRRISHNMISSCWAHLWISMSSWNEMSSQLVFSSSHTVFVAFSSISRFFFNH